MKGPLKITGNWLIYDSTRINLSTISSYSLSCQMLTLVSNGIERNIWFPDMPRADSPPTSFGQTAGEAAAQLDEYFSNYCHANA